MTVTAPTHFPADSPGPGRVSQPAVTRLLQRQILPQDRDPDVLSLYVDNQAAVLDPDKHEVGANRTAQQVNSATLRQSVNDGTQIRPDQIESRTALRLLPNERLSLGTYFNAFPASYWRRHTVVDAVKLSVTLRGQGATVIVYKSTANGRAERVKSAITETAQERTFSFDLSLKPFFDGGWYWYDVAAGEEEVVVASAEWSAEVPIERADHGTVDLCITTMNRPDFCAALLSQIGEDESLRPYLDTVFLMEQGTEKVAESPAFPAAEEALGSLLRVIEQGNLGGSGGYARGQLESLRKGSADYALMMDDDVVAEPEGIVRAVTFADLATRPTIVGGHMFSLYSKSRLHSFGEVVQPWRFWWQSAPEVHGDWDFRARNLRSTRWLHKRVDVDYNGWFMCMIPREVMAEIGLSLPLFIKWDDSEYGLRAKAAGFPTVTLPGMALWHIPWTDKNDALDWQSYFHQRNRFVAALLHSVYEGGGRMVAESFSHQVKHLVSMQYSTVALRHQALLDVLAGPARLHETLATQLPAVREMAKGYPDAETSVDRNAFPPVRRNKPPRKGKDDSGVPTGTQVRLAALKAPFRQILKPRNLSRRFPEAELPAMDNQWYRITKYDSLIVSMNDGQGAAFYQRDHALFHKLLRDTVAVHYRLRREWPRLAEEYRRKLGDVASPEAWDQTFAPWTNDQD